MSEGGDIPDFVLEAMQAAQAAGVTAEEAVPESTDEQAQHGIRCAECNTEVNPNSKGVLIEVIGWSKHRDTGGQNHVIRRKPTGRVLCPTCGLRATHGLATTQESLLGGSV